MRAAVVAVLMALSFAAAMAWRPAAHLADQRPKVDLEALFPKAFGEWQLDDRMPVQLVSPDAQAVLNKIYNQTLSRTYFNRAGDRIMLSVAYGGDQSDATRAHRPEVCYPAQGFQITARSQAEVAVGGRNLRVQQLVSKLGARNEPISYWVTVGERIALTGTEQKLAQLSYSLRGVIPDGMLVRVSSIDADVPRAYALHAAFLVDMSRVLPADTLPLILGRVVQ